MARIKPSIVVRAECLAGADPAQKHTSASMDHGVWWIRRQIFELGPSAISSAFGDNPGVDPSMSRSAFLGTNPADESMTFGLSIIWTKSAGDADYAFSVERSSKNSR